MKARKGQGENQEGWREAQGGQGERQEGQHEAQQGQDQKTGLGQDWPAAETCREGAAIAAGQGLRQGAGHGQDGQVWPPAAAFR